MNRKLIAAVVGALFLSGCATNYTKYLDQVKALNDSAAQTEQVRDAARQLDSERIASLGAGGGDIARIVAALAIAQQNMVADLAKGRGGSGGSGVIVPQPPTDPLASFVQVLGVVLPTASNIYAITKNTAAQVDMRRIDATIEQSRNQTFASIATAGINGVAGVNVAPNINTTVSAGGGDTILGNYNTIARRNCNGGSASSTGSAGNAAAGGNGAGTGSGGTSGAAGSTNPNPVAGGANC